jgi:hypothetical protein
VLFGRPTGGRHPKRSGVGLVVPWTNEVDLLLMQQKLKKGPGHGEIHAATVVDFCSRMVQNYCLRETIYCCCCCCCCYCCYCLLFLFFFVIIVLVVVVVFLLLLVVVVVVVFHVFLCIGC